MTPTRGIIPACAGSTDRLAAYPLAEPDHPRLRGEHVVSEFGPDGDLGSSPPARGARRPGHRHQGRDRIIPACAGSTSSVGKMIAWPRDHPRLRGEHGFTDAGYSNAEGSSPPARGAREPTGGSPDLFRIIPACAGSTRRCSESSWWRTDHPRLRGEHRSSSVNAVAEIGSSPPARGAPLSNLHCHEHCGIIPACAGSTQAADHSTTTGEDHPRLRGEHRRRQPMPARLRGSSPPARGAPQHDLGLHPVGRIIPACAGSTWPSKW